MKNYELCRLPPQRSKLDICFMKGNQALSMLKRPVPQRETLPEISRGGLLAEVRGLVLKTIQKQQMKLSKSMKNAYKGERPVGFLRLS